ncbi:MAG: gliding motility-associated C-terminal domain-containing protein [Bacteroidales bacterium]|nr:gliding motility-associated C-terminal domain-containing protein [Bacteroidales bacterium]
MYKTDLSGNGEWIRKVYGSQTENIQAVTADEYDNVYVLGNYGSPILYVDSTATLVKSHTGNLGNFDTYICKYNRSGVLQWLILKGSPGKDIYNDFILGNNIIFATGYFTNEIIFNNDTLTTSGLANSDAFVAAFNQIGDPISGVSIVGTGDYEDAGTTVNMDASSRAYVSGYYKSPQIQIGDQTYTSNNINKSDLFFAIYQQPFQAVITDERDVSCNGLSDGMLTVTPYFGRPPYTYSWSHNPSLNSPVADNLPAATYTVTITDANSVQAFKTETVTQPQPLAIAEIITPVSCNNGDNGAIDITVTGGTKTTDYSYFWTSLDGSGIVPLNQDQTGLTDGTYTVLVHDDNNCAVSEDIIVTQPARFDYAGTVVTPITVPPGSNGSINLSVTGGTSPYTFAWTGPSGSGYTATTEDIAVLGTAGLYTLTLTDNKSCTTDTSFAVTDNITMFAQVTAKTDVLCYGDDDGSATITVYNGTAPYSYEWSDGITISTATRTNMVPGNYNVLVTDGAMNTSQVPVSINAPPSALNLVLAEQDLRCFQDNSGVVNLTATGGMLPYSFSWSNGYTGEDLVNVAKGIYTITLTDANGCIAQATAELDEPGAIGLDITITGAILCYGEQGISATANTTGGVGTFSYLWDDPGTQVTKTAYDLAAGTYHVTVTDENGCTKTSSTTLLEPDPLVIEVELTEPSCPGLSDGIIAPTVTGGTPGFDYSWSNGKFERYNTNIKAGIYTLTVTDNNNCTLVQDFTLTDPDTVKITSVEPTDLTCSGQADGSIAIVATGGTGTFEYSVDGGDSFITTATIDGLAQGDYIVQVRDGNGCVSENYPVDLVKSETCGMVFFDAFSPNADGKNDVWHIGNVESFPNCSVKIFNIWGIAVFSSDGYGEPWDGKHEGNDLPSGTYYYVIDPGDGSETLTGAVSIVY